MAAHGDNYNKELRDKMKSVAGKVVGAAMLVAEACVVYGEKGDEAVKLLLATGDYEVPSSKLPTVLLAKPGSWCEYVWWTDRREAPDFASHVDIHNKPGFDPKELFLFNRGVVKGTHGRSCQVART